ncbi:hypothetical protein Tco_1172671 [Tanacetum coccineum]
MDDNQTMTQLLQAPTEGYEDAIVIPKINANFELKHGLINLVQNKQFFEHDKEDPHAHIRCFNKITSTMRFPDVPSTSIKLMLFPFSLEDTFYNALNANDQDSLNSAAGGNFLDKMPRECLRIIESKSKVRNSRNKAVVAKVSSNSSTPGISPDVAALTTEVSELKNMMKTMLVEKQKAQAPAPVKAVEMSCVTCGGAHSYRNCPATDGNVYQDNIQEYVSQAAAANFNQGNTNSRPPMNQGNNFNLNRGTNSNQNRRNNFYQGQVYQPPTSQSPVYQAQPYQAPAQQVQGQGLQNQIANLTDMLSKFVNANTASSSGTVTLPSNTVTNPKEDLKGITTRSGIAYKGPTIPTTSPKVVERETEVTKNTMPPTNNGSTEDVQPPVIPVVHHESIPEPVNAPVSAPMPNQKASIPFPSRRNDERRREKANDQIEKFYEIFRDLSFEVSFTDALMLMPKFASTLKTLIGNKEKLSEMARTSLNENCSTVILNKLPKKLGDPGRFLIPCEFSGINTCNSLADLGGQGLQNQIANLTDMLSKFVNANTASSSGTGTLPSNTVTNPKEDLKGITTRSGVAYKGPTIPTTSSPKVVERETEVTKDTMPPANNRSTEDVQPPVVPVVHHESISKPVNAPVSASMPNQKTSIPFPSRRNDERRQ